MRVPSTYSMTKIRARDARDTGIEHLRDARVLHPGEQLTLSCKAREDVTRIHTGLQELQGNRAF